MAPPAGSAPGALPAAQPRKRAQSDLRRPTLRGMPVEPSPFVPASREERWRALDERPPQVCVVGGGATGASVAFDLALRGLDVALFERDDWAAATSSASSRLLHGGLRYLEHGELGLVRESCLERERLLRNAAGLAWPERFAFPVRRGDRVGLAKLGAGLALYGLLSLPRPLGLPRLARAQTLAGWIPGMERAGLRGGGVYLDGATDDARLVLAVVQSAQRAGATCLSRAEIRGVEAGSDRAEVLVVDRCSGEERRLHPRAVVLCGGPFTEELRARAGLSGSWISPTRGAHVLIPRERLPTDGAVIFPSAIDGRVMFLLPWPRYTVIGTTDLDADASAPVRATRAEVRYLLDSANGLVAGAQLEEADVVSTYAGLRPLLAADVNDPSSRSREERVLREGPLWTIAGGKLTGMRSMAEGLCAQLVEALGEGQSGRRSATRDARLVGALPTASARPAWSTPAADPRDPLHIAWERRYAARAPEVEEYCRRAREGFRALDEQTLLGEVDWAVREEDCLGIDDFLMRRTDLGLGERSTATASIRIVAERMAELLAWSTGRSSDEQANAMRVIEAAHAWSS